MSNLLSRLFSTEGILKNHPSLGEVPSGRELLSKTVKMAWPSLLEAVLFAMVNFVDILMISKLGDTAIAAVGLTGQPRMLFFAPFFALQPAVSALIARRRGEDNRDSAVGIFKLALSAGLIVSVILSVVALFFADPILQIAGAEADTHVYAAQYLRIAVGGMIFAAMTLVINAGQRGVGNTKLSLRTNLTSNLVNIVFNYLLIGGHMGFPALGVRGAAIATVFGQFIGFIMALVSVLPRDCYISIFHKVEKFFRGDTPKTLAKVWSNTFTEQIVLRIGFLLYAMILARLGTIAFATHQIAMNFLTVSFAIGDGLSVAAISLVGFSLGQQRSDLAKIYGAFCQRLGILCSILFSLIYIIFGKALFSLFSTNPTVLHDGAIIMRLMTVIVLFQISQVIFSGCLRGAGDNRFITLVSIINIGILRPVLAYVFSMVFGLGIVGAWIGLIIDQAIRLVMTSIRFYRGKWTNIRI